jgi:hypothetical protein
MKMVARVRRRKDGSFQAMVQQVSGEILWSCEHSHRYGTSNRVKQDSASKCGHAQLKVMRNGGA